ncbi:acyl-CoA thioesterase/BAAT N-terminal domain-containing protein [Streptomyces sp. NBC_01619]|uniref:acyl-CoA thioesterase/bile acid-CoA:amino acid N-acyltransferase family protein n=1 Tax=Streptomyces sp. NBC_01619 TaxID=2975901 RepID=UPI0022574FFF|nr:acyl-CoA thioesterase/bile acid-CoA:amino acid N-acyltransferase family protein [Streptomyces sp. NBC_01619]MCX4514962.1 acyl-CoA thioesterase/BAAT N-terminal domain-containing protein [Streptomyces sp. NBC_01619]
MELTIAPGEGLVDEVPELVVQGLRPHEQVTVRIDVTDAAGRAWRSDNRYRADAHGVAGPAMSAPLAGSYSGVDPSGPWWSMHSVQRHRSPVIFTAPDDQLTWTVRCAADRARQVRRTVVRRWRARRVTRTESMDEGLRVVRFAPRPLGSGPRPVVVLIPGSTSMEAVTPTAALLASRCGFTTVVLGYVGGQGQPRTVANVPLERFTRAVSALAERRRVAVVAHSVGTGGALAALALARVPVRAVVAIAPTHVVWQALGSGGRPPMTSSWTYRAAPLPYVPVRGELLLPQLARHALLRRLPGGGSRSTALRLRSAYGAGLWDSAAVKKALIPVEHITAPLLAVAGTDDAVWPSEAMARALVERRRTVAAQDDLLIHPGAGHFMRPPLVPTTADRDGILVSGGTPQANALAQAETWAAMTRFLERHLGFTEPADA